jgi:large subunit ribosomal protein L11
MGFCKDYNDQTKSQAGSIVPVEITVFEDRTFTFITKTPPASDLLKKALNLEKGGGTTGQKSVGTISQAKIEEIAKLKMKDLNAVDLPGAVKIIKGTARSMGIEVQ